MTQITVQLGTDSYPILVQPGVLERAHTQLERFANNRRLFILTDDNVGSQILPELQHAFTHSEIDLVIKTLPPGETTKSWHQLENITDCPDSHQSARAG